MLNKKYIRRNATGVDFIVIQRIISSKGVVIDRFHNFNITIQENTKTKVEVIDKWYKTYLKSQTAKCEYYNYLVTLSPYE